ncbi:MAG: phosphomannomutase/phosphoglucomutase [Gammaproteobacteria bacterium]|nr:phosphomannomutase/phosphoglucomutase [Gammaproteobacteria bacterium]
MNISKEVFRAYDIRGQYPEQINEELYNLLGKALGTKILEVSKIKKVNVCMDGRLSGKSLKKNLIEGIISTGVDVIDIGMLPTPLLYFSLYDLDIDNGLMITGSHNPKNFNGIKMVINGMTLFDKYILELYDLIISKKFESNGRQGKIIYNEDILEQYIKKITADISIDFPFNVSIDCGNGVTGAVAKSIFSAFKINAYIINESVDGNFPNHPPDTSNEKNLVQLKDEIKSNKSSIGFAYDGDGDRIIVLKGNGDIIWPDQLMILFSRSILKNNRDAKIVYDVKCTKHLEDEIIKNNGIPVLSRTGHSFIKKAMIKEKALLGGEMSGHIFFADKWKGFDDGIYASIRLLEILSNNENYEEILNDLPVSVTTPEINIPFSGNNHFTFMDLFAKLTKFDNASIIDIDGLKIIYPDGWALIRCSNTSSNLVLRFEADNKSILNRIQGIVKKNMLMVDNNIKIPF